MICTCVNVVNMSSTLTFLQKLSIGREFSSSRELLDSDIDEVCSKRLVNIRRSVYNVYIYAYVHGSAVNYLLFNSI